MELSRQESTGRFATTGQCFHEPVFETESNIPGTDIIIVNCGVCGYEKRRYYKNLTT